MTSVQESPATYKVKKKKTGGFKGIDKGGPAKFWMVLLEGRQAPRRKHESLAVAYAEAKRLRDKENRTAHVLEWIGCIEKI